MRFKNLMEGWIKSTGFDSTKLQALVFATEKYCEEYFEPRITDRPHLRIWISKQGMKGLAKSLNDFQWEIELIEAYAEELVMETIEDWQEESGIDFFKMIQEWKNEEEECGRSSAKTWLIWTDEDSDSEDSESLNDETNESPKDMTLVEDSPDEEARIEVRESLKVDDVDIRISDQNSGYSDQISDQKIPGKDRYLAWADP
jgi:hypothetical protein